MHFPLLQDIVLLLGFSVAIVFFLQRLKLPPILGFLVTGVVIGPYGLSLIKAIHEVELLAEIGVTSIIGTTMMSWKIKIARALRPWGALISFLSWSTCSTIAVLDSEKRKPTNTASFHGKPSAR
jgi:CPA2 family monovalent cation:H+ antiporter-2